MTAAVTVARVSRTDQQNHSNADATGVARAAGSAGALAGLEYRANLLI